MRHRRLRQKAARSRGVRHGGDAAGQPDRVRVRVRVRAGLRIRIRFRLRVRARVRVPGLGLDPPSQLVVAQDRLLEPTGKRHRPCDLVRVRVGGRVRVGVRLRVRVRVRDPGNVPGAVGS